MNIMEESKMNIPCKDCKDRFVTEHYSCHSICELYKKWQKEHNKERFALAEKKSIDRDSYSIYDALEINRKHRRSKL